MAWLWASWQEYFDVVHPVRLDREGLFRLAVEESWFEKEKRLSQAAHELAELTESLRNLGFSGNKAHVPPEDPSILPQVRRLAEDAVFAGESLLLYHKRLAMSDGSYGFFHQHDVLDHWERYLEHGRIFREVHQLVADIDALLDSYYTFVQTDARFLVDGLDLPLSLKTDFRLARDLFSVGFDEVGLLIAGRGLEGVLRNVARLKKISLAAKGKTSPASEADFYDLIETMSQIRWKVKGTRLITSETKALLHYLRSLRNSGAHPAAASKSKRGATPRDVAAVIAGTASQIWNDVAMTRARLEPTTVNRTW
ncbi:MAG: hypothetical protein ACLPVW_14910 [Terriglobales bacterium]